MQNFDPHKVLQSLIQRKSGTKSEHQEIMDKLDEVLFYLNMAKNSATVSTGPYEALTRIYTGQLMYVDTRDNAMSPHLIMSGMWEENITKAFRKLVKERDTIIDVGANFGYFGTIAGADVGKNGRIVFVEANPYLAPYIQKSAAVNGLARNAHVANVAISNDEGSATFNLIKDNWVSSGLVDIKELSKADGIDYVLEEEIPIKTTTIDNLCRELKIENVDLIKMDIEGFEDKAFAGMTKTIKNSPNLKVLLEFTPDRYPHPKKFFKDLSNAFSFLYVIDESGGLKSVDAYGELEKLLKDNWAMVVAAQKPLG